MRPEVLKFQKQMEEKFGKNALRPASELASLLESRISTGSISLDIALGGGIPLGRFIQICGALSSCKSTISYHILKNAQNMIKELYQAPTPTKKKSGKKDEQVEVVMEEVPLQCALIQSESNSWTNEYGQKIGIDIDELLMNECAGMEEALEIAHKGQREGVLDVILIDSLEALAPMKEYASEMAESVQMGIKPKLFGEYFRKFQASNNKLMREDQLPTTVIGINQIREKIGAMGDPEVVPGGRAIGFAASIDIRLRRGDWISIGAGVDKQIIGQQVRFKIYKNKVGIPQRTGVFDFYFDEGGPVPPGHFDNFKEIVMEGVAYGIINKAGAWLTYEDVQEQGAEKFIAVLRERDDLFEEIRSKLMEISASNLDTSTIPDDIVDNEEEYEEDD